MSIIIFDLWSLAAVSSNNTDDHLFMSILWHYRRWIMAQSTAKCSMTFNQSPKQTLFWFPPCRSVWCWWFRAKRMADESPTSPCDFTFAWFLIGHSDLKVEKTSRTTRYLFMFISILGTQCVINNVTLIIICAFTNRFAYCFPQFAYEVQNNVKNIIVLQVNEVCFSKCSQVQHCIWYFHVLLLCYSAVVRLYPLIEASMNCSLCAYHWGKKLNISCSEILPTVIILHTPGLKD